MIIHQGPTIHGLTTAATIWCSSAIDRMAAAGFYNETFISVGLVVFINFILFRVDEWIDKISDRQNNTDKNGS